jgi:hypothetical protein
VFDALIATDAKLVGGRFTLAGGTGDTGYFAFDVNALDVPHPAFCFFTLAPGGAGKVETDPFALPGGTFALNALVADGSGSPHAFVSGRSAVTHFTPTGGRWEADTIAVPALVDHAVTGASSAGNTVRVLFSVHPPDAGYARLFTLHLASREAAGAWKRELVFDAAGKVELVSSHLALDGTGAPHAVFTTRAYPGPTWDVLEWRAGVTPASLWREYLGLADAAVPGAGPAAAGSPILISHENEGIQLLLPGSAPPYRKVVLDGTGLRAFKGCPPDLMERPDRGCGASKDVACTLTGQLAAFPTAIERTEDGSVWLAYVDRRPDVDVRLREECGGGMDPFCYCRFEVVADRSTPELVLARVSTAASTSVVDVRLRARLAPVLPLDHTYQQLRMDARGSRLFIGVSADLSYPTVYRYLVVDTAKLP